jgi:hypothetical protein
VTLRRFVLRAAALCVMALGIGGPTPGYVGNCDAGGGSSASVDPTTFCTYRDTYFCARDHAAMRISDAQYNTCIMAVAGNCNGFNFPPGCAPSMELAQTCYNALLASGMLATTDMNITECQTATLCGTSMLEGI